MGNNTYDAYNRALQGIVRAYEAEDYDAYESRIERVAKRFCRPYDQVEDDATDYRLFGEGANDFIEW